MALNALRSSNRSRHPVKTVASECWVCRGTVIGNIWDGGDRETATADREGLTGLAELTSRYCFRLTNAVVVDGHGKGATGVDLRRFKYMKAFACYATIWDSVPDERTYLFCAVRWCRRRRWWGGLEGLPFPGEDCAGFGAGLDVKLVPLPETEPASFAVNVLSSPAVSADRTVVSVRGGFWITDCAWMKKGTRLAQRAARITSNLFMAELLPDELARTLHARG